MAKSILDIVIRFAKEGDADKDSIRALTNIKTSVSSAMVAMTAMAGVAATLSGVVLKTTEIFKEYAFQVEDMSRLTGGSVEETSRLIQVADDVRISYETLQKAMWFAAKNGVEVNVESLARLSDQYSGLNSATERAAFLAKNFGKGGADLARLMELQGDGIRSASAAQDEWLVLSDESIRKAHDLYRAQDELADSWRGMTTAVGELLAEPLAQNLSIWADLITAINQEARDGNPLFNWLDVLKGLAQLRIDQHLADVAESASDATDGLGEINDAVDPAALEAYKSAMSDLSTVISGDLGKTYDNFTEKIADLNLEMENARSTKDKAGIQAQIDAETAAYERQTNAILYNIQSQILMRSTEVTDEEKLAVLSGLAEHYGLIDEKTRAVVDSTNTLIGSWMSGALTTDEFIDRLSHVNKATGAMITEIEGAASATARQHGATKDVTVASENSQEPLDGMATSMNVVGKQADYASGEINQVIAQAKALDGMVSVVTIIINTLGEVPSVGSFSQGHNVARCFAAGTPVQMGDGTRKAIEEIKVGDVVQSMDVERRELVQAKVERVFEHAAGHAGVLLEVTFAGPSTSLGSGAPALSGNAGAAQGDGENQPLRVTPEHKLYINGEWTPAWSLRAGDELSTTDGETIRVAGVWRTLVDEAVYNLETGHETHNYFAGGVLVHNGKTSLAGGGQWQPGDWAIVGDMPGGGIGPYTEVIDPWGRVHNAAETKRLARMGLLKGAKSLYETEGSGSILDSAPSRRIRRPDDNTPFLSPNLGEMGLGAGLDSGGVATLGDIIAPMQESAAMTGQAAQAAAMASDRQADQSVKQTGEIRAGNAAIVDELQALRRELPDAFQDAAKLLF